ncbi:MAG: indolepyruvate ferredoxin oxidoreductase subunit alpha [Armatimonadota bacterium]|nr:indolepyruvate ferredoxin oxidoreductase subunit alpha [Armatimonadota bacterium]
MSKAVPTNRKVLSGNEAIAHAAYAAGVQLAAAYPGTPSTEILENIAEFKDIYCEWSVNEKVALEVAIGASFAGARALAAMKHVGLNVALDPLMTFAYIGATGGLVIVSADDPSMHSSQNEQDNRTLAKFARIPVLEPADSQECFDMVRAAYEISEQFELPVLVRTTTRISHSSGIVDLGTFERRPRGDLHYKKDIARTVMVPLFARQRRTALEGKLEKLRAFSQNFEMHRIEPPTNDRDTGRIGIITSGVAYAYVKEELPSAAILKLGMSFPLPERMIREFAASVDRLYVVEEGDAFIEEQVLAMGLRVEQPKTSLRIGELNPDRLKRFAAEIEGREPEPSPSPATDIPARPPVMCPGCAHRGVFYALNRLKATVLGDIGCYSLGAFEPLYAMDSIVCMGASIGNAHGMQKSGYDGERIAAVIGDSTFFHSGITGLLNTVYNKGTSTVIVLDNRTTAMTGHQDHPGTGRTLMGEETVEARVEDVARGVGVQRVVTIDPYDLENTYNVLKEELGTPEPSVVVSRRECVLRCRDRARCVMRVDETLCKACGACLRLGCPAIEIADQAQIDTRRHKVRINPVLCAGCGMCRQVCRFEAICEAPRKQSL